MSYQKSVKEFNSSVKSLQSVLEKSLKASGSNSKEKKTIEESMKELERMKAIFSETAKSDIRNLDPLQASKEIIARTIPDGSLEVAKAKAKVATKNTEEIIKEYPLQSILGAFIVGIIMGKL